MRLTLAIIIAATGGLALMFLLAPSDREREVADLQRRPAAGGSQLRRADGNPIDLEGARARDLFTPQQRKKVLPDGTELRWISALVWCGSFESDEDERHLFQDLRVVLNSEPNSEADITKHHAVPPELPTDRIGDHLARTLSGGATGLRAGTAVFIGGRELKTAHALELRDGVLVTLTNGTAGARKAIIRAPSLHLDVEDGRIVRGTSADEVTIETDQGTLRGRQFEVDVEAGTLALQEDIQGTLKDLNLVGQSGPPATVTATGPLTYVPAEARDDKKTLRPAGALRLLGDVVISQGEHQLRGERLTIKTLPGSQLDSFVIENDVSAQLPQGTFTGDRITYTARASGQAQIVLNGKPVRATLRGGARALPGISARGDLTLTTDGQIVFERVDAPQDIVREIVIGPEVAIEAKSAHVNTKVLRVFLHRVASNRAGADPTDRETSPGRIEATGAVRGQGDRGSFRCESLVYERKFHPTGLAREDRVTLAGNPELIYARDRKREEKEAPESHAGSDLLGGDGPLHINARDRITLITDPMRIRATIAQARGGVIVRRLDSSRDDHEQGHLEAEKVDLELSEQSKIDLAGDDAELRFLPQRRVKRADARGQVAVRLPDRFSGEGDRLAYDSGAGTLRLDRTTANKSAVVVITDRRGHRQTIRAPAIEYREQSRSLVATGGGQANIWVAPISYGTGVDATPVSTIVRAQRVVAWYSESNDKVGKRTRHLKEILAENGVKVSQGKDTGLACSLLRLDVEREEMLIRGTPARLDLVRREGEKSWKEWIVANAWTITGGEALLEGPVKARFHARRGDLALRVADDVSRDTSDNSDLLPIDIDAQRDLYLSELRIQARGKTTIVQGDLHKDGFRVQGEKIALFLIKEESPAPGGKPSKRLQSLRIARAVIEKDVVFRSPELLGEGDVMEFDEKEKVVTLYRWKGDANLTWRGRHQGLRPRFDLDLSDADNPVVISVLEPPARGQR